MRSRNKIVATCSTDVSPLVSTCRNRELDELWPQIHAKDAEISQLKDHTEMLMRQLEAAEAKALQLETCLHGVRDGKIQPNALKESLADLLKRALAFKSS